MKTHLTGSVMNKLDFFRKKYNENKYTCLCACILLQLIANENSWSWALNKVGVLLRCQDVTFKWFLIKFEKKLDQEN